MSLSFSLDSKVLATLTSEGAVRLWDLETKQSRILFKTKQHTAASSIAFAPGSNILAMGGFGNVKFVDVNKEVVTHETAKDHNAAPDNIASPTNLVFTPDGTKLAGASGRRLWIWDPKTGREWATLSYPGKLTPLYLAFSPDGKMLAVSLHGVRDDPNYLEIWDVENKKNLGRFLCHPKSVHHVAWSPDGKMLATASMDKTVKIWDVAVILAKIKE